jgi:hypothetical protein
VSATIWSTPRTAEVPSSRNRARVAPGPTRALIALGCSEAKRSSSVRSSPMASTVVRASRSADIGGMIRPLCTPYGRISSTRLPARISTGWLLNSWLRWIRSSLARRAPVSMSASR